jgi:hypothetical protein
MNNERESVAEQPNANGILLFTVTDHFAIEGRGCVVLPGIPDPSPTTPVLRGGASITLRRPDGSEVESVIRELEMLRPRPPTPFTPILLPLPITKSDVPIGTEVWYFPTAVDTYANERTA